jgi:hypothetical protein
MNGEQLFMLLFGLIILGYVVLYIGGRNYLRDGFQSGSGGGAGAGSPSVGQLFPTPMPVPPQAANSDGSGRVLMEYTTMDPVAKGQLQNLDDYERNMVFQHEADNREISQALKNKLMSQRPLEWAGLPPSSEKFQAGLRESFENATPTVPNNAQPFVNISGENMIPPDTEGTEMEERKLLQAYKAPTAEKLSTYSADEDPDALIKRIYDVKGLIPTVAHKEGTNVYEVIGVRRKDEKILYEDEEAPASRSPVQRAGEAKIMVPASAYDTAVAADPYYDTTAAGGKARAGKWDYQAWTPGLERMFAPTNATEAWS